MLTDQEILDALHSAPLATGPQSFVLAIGRAIEAKVLAKQRAQLRPCQFCDVTPGDAHGAYCRSRGSMVGGALLREIARPDGVKGPDHG